MNRIGMEENREREREENREREREENREREKHIGLHLPDQTIHRLSGPISMFYLRPDPEVTKEYMEAGIVLPLVMLWGDQHQSVSGQCDPCICPNKEDKKEQKEQKDKKDKCCRAIYDPSFVKSLDKLATDYPIDFYTELDRDRSVSHGHTDNILFYHFLSKLTQPCHDVSLRSKNKYQTMCPTRNIRWHYSDVRFEKDTLEGSIINPFRIFLQTIMPRFYAFPLQVVGSRQLLDHLERLSKTFFSVPAPARLPYPSKKDRETLKKNGQIVRNELLRILFQWTGSPTSKFKDIHVKFKILLKIHLLYLTSDPHSVIFKQIRKMPTQHFEQMDHLMDMIYPTYFYIYQRYFEDWEKELSKHTSTVLEMIRIFLSGEASHPNGYASLRSNGTKMRQIDHAIDSGLEEKWKWLLHKLDSLLVYMDSYMVELYTVMRMIKPPQGSHSPVIVFGFYGNAHTKSLVNWLLGPLFSYELVFETGETHPTLQTINQNKPNMRCLLIDQSINLEKEMREHVLRIQEQGQEQGQGQEHNRFTPYRNVLKRERNSRKANRNRILEEEDRSHEEGLMAMENPFLGGGRGKGKRGGSGKRGGKGKTQKTQKTQKHK